MQRGGEAHDEEHPSTTIHLKSRVCCMSPFNNCCSAALQIWIVLQLRCCVGKKAPREACPGSKHILKKKNAPSTEVAA